jgi:hypothetical protein
MSMTLATVLMTAAIVISARTAAASGHGPLFGGATPTLGRGGWSVDQAWTLRGGDEDERQQMLKTMLSFGVTENLQVSGSLPLAMSDGRLAPARMMSAMSNDREFEGLASYRFQRRPVGIGGRQESTLFAGGTARLESRRNGVAAGASVEAGASTGYASRARREYRRRAAPGRCSSARQHCSSTRRSPSKAACSFPLIRMWRAGRCGNGFASPSTLHTSSG